MKCIATLRGVLIASENLNRMVCDIHLKCSDLLISKYRSLLFYTKLGQAMKARPTGTGGPSRLSGITWFNLPDCWKSIERIHSHK